MALRRVAAVLVAVALVVGAFLVRSLIDDGGDESGPDDSTPGTETVVCITDLADACEEAAERAGIEVEIEDWTATVGRFARDEVSVWITVAPLDALANQGEALPIASSPLAMVVERDRSEEFEAGCPVARRWRCVGEHAGDPWTELGGERLWGDVFPGIADPSRRAMGAIVLGSAHVAYFDRSDFTRVDIDADDGYASWFDALVNSVPAGALDDPLGLILRQQSAVGVVGTTEAAFESRAAARRDDYTLSYPEPMGRADVVVVGDQGDFTTQLAEVLGAMGWDPPATDSASGLPSAQSVQLVTGLWQETRR